MSALTGKVNVDRPMLSGRGPLATWVSLPLAGSIENPATIWGSPRVAA